VGLVVLSLSSGHSARYLLDAVAAGRENYYTGAVAAGEPPGRWYGAGAAKFGLTGLVDSQDMIALYERFIDPADPAFKDPSQWEGASKLGHTGLNFRTAEQIYQQLLDANPGADAERRDQLRVQASKQERHNVAFHDATFNVQKSVTVLHTAFDAQEVKARNSGNEDEAAVWGEFKKVVEDAIWAGNKAALDYMATHAGYTRVGSHGGKGGRWADAHEWTVASFFQHDSRDHDPHLHIHNAILNRVQGPDGQWITLDSKGLYAVKPAAGALGKRVMQEYLSAATGIEFRMREDGTGREVVGIPQEVMDLFSSRRRAITPKVREWAEAFEAKYNRPPNPLEKHDLAQRATLLTRKSKSHTGQTREEMLEGWHQRLLARTDGGLTQTAHDALNARPEKIEPGTFSAREVIETALAALQEKQSSFTESQLLAEIDLALPDIVGITDSTTLGDLLDSLKDEAMKLVVPLDAARAGDDVLPAEFRLANGASAFDAPAGKRYATPEHLDIERLLRAATAKRDARVAISADAAHRFTQTLANSGTQLGADQAAAVTGILTSGARVESLVGPAGTGKSFVVGVLTKAWQDPDLWSDGAPPRRVFGLATSQKAADILAAEGVTSANTSKWLATQNRLAGGRAKDGDAEWELRPGDLVVVDESSMASMQALHGIRERVEAVGAKMLPTGDFRQLGAIGAEGGMEMMAEAGNSYELTEARRFHHQWERAASLRLRDRDPAVFTEYHKNGRVIDAGAAEQAERSASLAWLADMIAGKHAVLIVDQNEQAYRINAQLRAELVKLGQVDEHGVFLGHDGTFASVGDLVRGRRLAWDVQGFEGNTQPAKTSEQYRVLEVRDDGAMVVAPITQTRGSRGGERLGDRLVLPASYVAKDLALGYAITDHGTQGVTADVGHEIVTHHTSANALYAGATRGQESNTLHVVTQAAAAGIDAETGDTARAPRRNPRAILEEILERATPERSASTTATEDAAEAANVQTPLDRVRAACEVAVTERTTRWLDQLASDGHLTEPLRRRLAAEDGGRKLSPLLRRLEMAGHDAEAVLTDAVAAKSLDGSHEVTNVIYKRVTNLNLDLDPRGTRFSDWTPQTGNPGFDRYLATLAKAADARRDELGAQTAEQAPQWATDAFGPVPAEPQQLVEWTARAGQVAVYREQMGHEDPVAAIGQPPKPGLVESYAAWRAAWRALGRPDTDTDEQHMSDGRLRLRVRAYEREQAWAPPSVANKLAGTIQAAEHHHQTATLRSAEADAASDPDERAKLLQEAHGHTALAQMLDNEVPTLRELDQTHQEFVEHAAGSRSAAERAIAELANRGATDTEAEPQVTAQEWLQAHHQAMAQEDPYRDITEGDLADDTCDITDTDTQTADQRSVAGGEWEEDLRETASREPASLDEAEVRAYTPDEAHEAVARARRAVEEMQRRAAADAAREAEDDAQAERLGQWQAADHAQEHEHRHSSADSHAEGVEL
jgi:conjugative relaxase-like TrwC/TraI family protein